MGSLVRLEGIGEPAEILVAADPDAAASASADRVCRWLAEASGLRGAAHLALTGGSSAAGLARELRRPERRGSVPWEQVHLWWGDERYVPMDHPYSNAGAAFRDLLGPEGIPVPHGQVHPIPIETGLADAREPAWVAEAYAAELLTMVPLIRGLPALDVILLGVGPDGHIFSVFPGSPALAPDAPLVMPIPAPAHVEPHVARITLSPRLLEPAGHVMPMVPGAAKAVIVSRILAGEHDPEHLPAQLAVRANATWLLDAGSAAGLRAAP